jgi:DNA-binding transcriptional regulator YiaG
MNSYRYTDCGLDNVIIDGVSFVADDAGDEVLSIPNINGLHHVIALGIVTREAMMNGREMRFLRTEMGMTQAELAAIIHREPLTISRWERGESEIDANAETIVRLLANEKLGLEMREHVGAISGWSVPRAMTSSIHIDGTDPNNYKLAA